MSSISPQAHNGFGIIVLEKRCWFQRTTVQSESCIMDLIKAVSSRDFASVMINMVRMNFDS